MPDRYLNELRALRHARPPVLMRIWWSVVVLAIIMVIGTFGFPLFSTEGSTYMDGFFMTAITVTTVGYGEHVPLQHTWGARIFAFFIGFAGFGTVTFMFSSLTVFFLETDLNKAIGRRRMEKAIKKLHKHYILCGYGRVGRNIAVELESTGRHFVAIDENLELLEALKEKNPGLLYLHGDASDDDCLLAADIEDARGLFAVTGDDSRNLMIVITAKQLNPQVRVVARCHEVRN
ncbi:MAG: NAD-binding protein, partial [Rhodocyclaceae bacterium]|nr:NAD-binding protein [Rhodocyclaceae bacterium]